MVGEVGIVGGVRDRNGGWQSPSGRALAMLASQNCSGAQARDRKTRAVEPPGAGDGVLAMRTGTAQVTRRACASLQCYVADGNVKNNG